MTCSWFFPPPVLGSLSIWSLSHLLLMKNDCFHSVYLENVVMRTHRKKTWQSEGRQSDMSLCHIPHTTRTKWQMPSPPLSLSVLRQFEMQTREFFPLQTKTFTAVLMFIRQGDAYEENKACKATWWLLICISLTRSLHLIIVWWTLGNK